MSHLSEIQLFCGPKIYRNFQNFEELTDNIDRKNRIFTKRRKKKML